MHEFSLAQSLMEQLLDLAREHQARRILRVELTLGPFCGVVAESFAFGFDLLKASQKESQEAVLELVRPDPEYLCLDCRVTSILPFPGPMERLESVSPGLSLKQCPQCGSHRLSPQGGAELILNHVEME